AAPPPAPTPRPAAAPRAPRPPAGTPPPPPPGAPAPLPPPPPPAPPDPAAWFPSPFEPDTDLRIQALGSLLEANPDRVIPLLRLFALESKDSSEAPRAGLVL